jgi:ribosomal protein S18 acetylase RimI-like enzyme
MSDREHPLDNPTWHGLTGPQSRFAEGWGPARRFRSEVSIFGAIAEDTPEAWSTLAAVVGAGRDVVVNRAGPIAEPAGWTLHGAGVGHQMVLEGEPQADDAPNTRELTTADVPEMMALVKLTAPGPFREGTIQLGGYRGIFDDGRLMAMAGRRVATDQFVEVSAVCTHPDGRRRGYAAAITATVARGILESGRTPILHVAESNLGAKSVYDKLGFVTRTTLTFAFLRPN